MSTKVYVEGGGNAKALRTLCRQGFREFFRKIGFEGSMPRIIAGGSRQQAFGLFCTALKNANSDEFVILLVDAEAPVMTENDVWDHLECRDGWVSPQGADTENTHLMVQCMESWFLADKQSLATFFGDKFNLNALPANTSIEQISKQDVLEGLKNATRGCEKKGVYGKGQHSFKILALLDPDRVINASPHAERLINAMRCRIGRQ